MGAGINALNSPFKARPDIIISRYDQLRVLWAPSGDRILFTVNHTLRFDFKRFVRSDWDGSNKTALEKNVLGSRHPTLHSNGRHLPSDCYQREPMTAKDGIVLRRLIDLDNNKERHSVALNSGCSRFLLRHARQLVPDERNLERETDADSKRFSRL